MNGTQQNRPPVRRRLTPQQRKALERKRRIRKLKQNLKYIIPAAAILILAVILIVVFAGRKDADETVPAAAISEREALEVISVEEKPLNDEPTDPLAEPVALEEIYVEPEPTEEPAAVPESTGSFDYEEAYVRAVKGEVTGPSLNTVDYSAVDPAKMNRWPEIEADALPVLTQGANMNENLVCITVDDCFQASNLKKIVQCALDNNGKLTIFPIGSNLEKQAIADVVKWAWENGMEIENHTYNHAGLYHFDDKTMTDELWYQKCRLSMVLGVIYNQHFFRPHGGDERKDQRVQAYCAQLGMYGIVHWMESGSSNSVSKCLDSLAPGNIYLYHTTDSDCQKLLQIIPEITARGYRLVTVNEMFGLPENETSDLSTLDINAKPEFKSFKVTIPSLKKTTYSRAGAVVQKRLIELGWLGGDADGEFGANSYMATGFFQVASGIKGTGVCDPETQAALFADDAQHATPEQIEEMKKQYEAYKK